MKRDYALLIDRVKAAFVDALILIAMMFAASEILALFDEVPNFVRIVLFIFIFILYDPLLTSFYGGTIGHSMNGLGVRKDNDSDQNIRLHLAVLRFLLKSFLGWISLLTVTGNDKKQALHDFAANSVVVKVAQE